MSNKKKGFIFYDNWCDMVNKYYDRGDIEAASMLSFAIVRLYSTGEIIDLPRFDLEQMMEYTVMPGIETQITNYENGSKGGRARVELNKDEVYEKKRELKTWKATAAYFGVDEDTLRARRKEWEESENRKTEKPTETEPKNRIKVSVDEEEPMVKESRDVQNQTEKPKNQEKEEEEEKEEEKLIEGSASPNDSFRANEPMSERYHSSSTELVDKYRKILNR
jgi:hypothetical protein